MDHRRRDQDKLARWSGAMARPVPDRVVQFAKDPCSSTNSMPGIVQEEDYHHHGGESGSSSLEERPAIESQQPLESSGGDVGSMGSIAAAAAAADDHRNPTPISPRAAMPPPPTTNPEHVVAAATPAAGTSATFATTTTTFNPVNAVVRPRPHPAAVQPRGYRGATMVLPTYVAGLGTVSRKRYRESMDYAHLGCRHFIPCDDDEEDDDDDGDREDDLDETTLPKTMVTVNQRVMAFKVGERDGAGAGAEQEGVTVKWIDLDEQQRRGDPAMARVCGLEQQRHDLSRAPRVDPSKVKKGDEVVESRDRRAAAAAAAAAEMGIRGELLGNKKNGCFPADPSSSMVKSSGYGNRQHQHQHQHFTRKNARKKAMGMKEEEEGDEELLAARSGGDDRGKPELGDGMDDPSPAAAAMSEAALDVLAEAAIQASSSPPPPPAGEDCSGEMVEISSDGDAQEVDELGRRVWRRARFVHGEIQFVQKRVVRRCARPGSKLAMQSKKQEQEQEQELELAAQPVRASQRRIAQQPRKLLADEFEYGDARKERSRNEDQDEEQQGGAKRKNSSGVELGNGNSKKVAKKIKGAGAGHQKKRNLSTVVRKSEAKNMVASETATTTAILDHRQLQFVGDGDHDDERHLEIAAPVPVMVVEDSHREGSDGGAVVRSTRGRSQNLPLRLQGSVIGNWRKGDKKKTPKTKSS